MSAPIAFCRERSRTSLIRSGLLDLGLVQSYSVIYSVALNDLLAATEQICWLRALATEIALSAATATPELASGSRSVVGARNIRLLRLVESTMPSVAA
jgi:hypothetical protein